MSEPILDTNYWKERLLTSPLNERHHAIFKCPLAQWNAIEGKHRKILSSLIKPKDSILDIGCAWGRLLSLLPVSWDGFYCGIDISPDFIQLARWYYPSYCFYIVDLCKPLIFPDKMVDWGIAISIRPMIKRNLSPSIWNGIEFELKRTCRKLLFLEYDENDNGEVIVCE